MASPRIGIVVSHPIQHWCPQYSSLAATGDWELRVFFGSRAGLDPYFDPGFGERLQWRGLPLEFPHEFLNDGRTLALGPRLDAPDLGGHLAAFDPDVLIVYGYGERLQRRAAAWASKRGKRLLMINDNEDLGARTSFHTLRRRLILPRIYGRMTGFLTLGDANRSHYLRHGATLNRLFFHGNPIDRDAFDRALQDREGLRGETRSRYGLKPDEIACTIVGKLVPWKRQADLLRAAARLTGVGLPVRLLIVGTGQREKSLRNLAADIGYQGAVFTGFLEPLALPAIYAATDIYVHTSSIEPHSLAITEAVYAGCPVVCSNRCGSYGPTDDVRPGENGFVYRCGDIAELSDVLERLVGDPQLRTAFSNQSSTIGRMIQARAHGTGLRSALVAMDCL